MIDLVWNFPNDEITAGISHYERRVWAAASTRYRCVFDTIPLEVYAQILLQGWQRRWAPERAADAIGTWYGPVIRETVPAEYGLEEFMAYVNSPDAAIPDA